MEKSRFNANISAKLSVLVTDSFSALFPSSRTAEAQSKSNKAWDNVTKKLNTAFVDQGTNFSSDQVEKHWKYLKGKAKECLFRHAATTGERKPLPEDKLKDVIELYDNSPAFSGIPGGKETTTKPDVVAEEKKSSKRKFSMLDTPTPSKRIKTDGEELFKLQKQVLLKQSHNADQFQSVLSQASFFFQAGANYFLGNGEFVVEEPKKVISGPMDMFVVRGKTEKDEEDEEEFEDEQPEEEL